jgi:hypothetical protein
MFENIFNPRNWFWLADDGRLFSSSAGIKINKTDASFVSFKNSGINPTPWPRDDSGAQTDAALNDVLAPYGLTMDGKPALAPLTFLAFLGLFTSDEQTAIVSSDDPQIRLFCLMAAGASGVDLSDPRTVAGTNQLETLKLIGKGRAKQVLAAQAPPDAPTTQTAA